MTAEIFSRTALAAGEEMMNRLARSRVLVVGLGGVGSWCAEALVRSGIGHLTIIDPDTVAVTNINRQLPATTLTVGRPKVEVLAERFRAINPDIDLTAMQASWQPDGEVVCLDDYDYVIDAIDTLECKADLILRATASKARLFSSMGAARKLHASAIETAEFWKVTGDPLARALRQKFKRRGTYPKRKFKCVYSPELIANRGESAEGASGTGVMRKGAPNGTFAHTTAIFGLTLAGLVIEDLY